MTLPDNPPPTLDLGSIDFLSVLDRLDNGVIISDREGTILFYNQAQSRIDGIPVTEAVGMKVTDIYDLTNRTSMIMLCIHQNAAIKNQTFFYRTGRGRVVNALTSTYPLHTGGRIDGAICFVMDYERVRRSSPPAGAGDTFHADMGNNTRFTFSHLIGSGHGFRQAIEIARKAAASVSPIMLQGETGTGKELFAQAIHNHGPRREKPFVAVNCGAIPHDLLEGLLFGTSRGAFTGALDRPGLFETAHGSTLFLDEILSMPPSVQAKLLRALQEKRVRRLGSTKETPVDVKVISSVNQDPRAAIQANLLRTDLYYRLGVVIIKLPPLRERPDSIDELAGHFIDKYNRRLGTRVKQISPQVMDLLYAYRWPGNIRELEHLIEGAMNMAGQDETIDIRHFGSGLTCMEPADMTCEQTEAARFQPAEGRHIDLVSTQKKREQAAVKAAMTAAGGNVTRAARYLGISRQLLHYKLKKSGLTRLDFIDGHPAPVSGKADGTTPDG